MALDEVERVESLEQDSARLETAIYTSYAMSNSPELSRAQHRLRGRLKLSALMASEQIRQMETDALNALARAERIARRKQKARKHSTT